MSNKLKCAVIGVGVMGKSHVRTYAQIPHIELVAISDINAAEGKKVAEQFQTKFYQDYRELLEKEKPDIVSVCVPTSFHYPVAKYCMSKKINILLEKPIAGSVEEARKLVDFAKKNKVKFLVGRIERFNPAVKHVKMMIKRGDLGQITSLIFRRVGGFPPQIKDANIAVDLAIHDIDIANYLLEDLPKSITVYKKKNHIKRREDSVDLFLTYKNASAFIEANWITPVKIRKINITGTDGYLEMDYITQKIEFYRSNYEKFNESSGTFSDFILVFSEPDRLDISVAKKEPLKEELLYFIDCVRKNVKIDTSFAVEALKIALH